jgi:formamidopyrimidine-DNA glycosylase
VALRGSSIRDYRDAWGARGEAQERLRVYGRSGQPCLRCGEVLQRTSVGGRGTTYCPHCQR